MMLVAFVIAILVGELWSGIDYLTTNPAIFSMIMRFSLCSAFGQSFIFYTISTFDPLVCATVTTTRKVFTVLLSIFTKGHHLNAQGWTGIILACTGIVAQLYPSHDP